MDKIIHFEKRQTSLWLKIFISSILILITAAIIYFWMAVKQLQQRQTLELLALLGEDREVIEEFWQDTLAVFLEEFPRWSFVYGSVTFITVILLFLITKRKRQIVSKKLQELANYTKRDKIKDKSKIMDLFKGDSMPKKTLPLFLILILFILGILVLKYQYQKEAQLLPKGPKTTPTTERVTQTPTQPPTIFENIQPKPTQAATLLLDVSSPADGLTVTASSLTVKGKTAPGAEVFVNERETVADAQGNFAVTITLDEGDNYIVVSANDQDGNSAEKELTIIYDTSQ